MRCEEIQEYLAERLAGSLSDRLSATVYSHVRTHMLSCPECCEELEDFEEMQKVLQTIPVEPCDSNAMRARFHLLLGPKETESFPRNGNRFAPLIRPLKVALFSIAAIVAVIAVFLAARQAVKSISVAREAAQLSPPAATPSPKPVAAAVRTGSIAGQIRASDPKLLGKVRVSVAAVPKSGIPSTEITVEADAEGKYRLDNIPAGQYYVLARLVDGTRYYPGTTDIAGATIVSIQAGAVLDGIDFPNIVSSVRSLSPTVPVEPAEVTGPVRLEDGNEVAGPQVVHVDVTLRLDTGGRLPYWPDTSIVFIGSTEAIRVAASCVVGNLFRASVPADESYALTVSNIAAGYAIQSIVDTRMTDLMHGGHFTPVGRTAVASRIIVTLTKN